jgi:hypothetical protein
MHKNLATVLVLAVGLAQLLVVEAAAQPKSEAKPGTPAPGSAGVFTGMVDFIGAKFTDPSDVLLTLREYPQQSFSLTLKQAISFGIAKELTSRDFVSQYQIVGCKGWTVKITCKPLSDGTFAVRTLKVLSRVKALAPPDAQARMAASTPPPGVQKRVPEDTAAPTNVAETGHSGQNVERKKADPTALKDLISDYLTLIAVWQSGRVLLDKHHFEEAKAKGTVAIPESFEAVLISGDLVALKFHATWIDPLPVLVDNRGDFPPMQVRNGAVSPVDNGLRLDIDISYGTEVMVDSVAYVYKGGQWKEM